MEQNLHQGCGVDIDLLRKIGERSALPNADFFVPTTRNLDAANGRRILLLELLTLRALRLPTPLATSPTTAKRAGRCATAATATTARRT